MWLSGLTVFAAICIGDLPVTSGVNQHGIRADEALESPVTSESNREGRRRTVSNEDRAETMSRAHVWRTPATAIDRAYLGNEHDAPERLDCWFKLTELGGTTPKFDCALQTSEEIRIKYGYGAEIPAEVAATRLMRALGFGADTVTMVERLRCHGCPEEPFVTMKVVEVTRTAPLYARAVNHRDYEDFEWVALEQQFPATAIESADHEGWALFELDGVDASKGGAPRAHVDALRLMAMFLAHWDNKARNQRLVCLTETWPEGTRCPEPFLLLQDVGATFGPRKVNLNRWEKAPIWESRSSCTLSMRDMPHDGATFGRAHVTDAGRRFLADLLDQLTDTQLTELFTTARFDKPRGPFRPSAPAAEWVRVFKAKVSAIREGPACPEP